MTVPAGTAYIAGDSVTVRATATKANFADAHPITRAVAVDLAAPVVAHTPPDTLTVNTEIAPMDPATVDIDIAGYAVKAGSPLPAGMPLKAFRWLVVSAGDRADDFAETQRIPVTVIREVATGGILYTRVSNRYLLQRSAQTQLQLAPLQAGCVHSVIGVL